MHVSWHAETINSPTVNIPFSGGRLTPEKNKINHDIYSVCGLKWRRRHEMSWLSWTEETFEIASCFVNSTVTQEVQYHVVDPMNPSLYSCSKLLLETTEEDQHDVGADASVAAVLLDLGFHFTTPTGITRTDSFDGNCASLVRSTDCGKTLVKY